MAIRCYQFRIQGKVQGVGYRQAARAKARALGLNGYVKNLNDGTVYGEMQGEESALQQMIDWCHYGPTLARVDSVQIEPTQLQRFGFFEIRY
jgi:acylphosphatase